MQKLTRILFLTILMSVFPLHGNSYAASEKNCPTITDAATKARFKVEKVSDDLWQGLGPNGPFYVEEERELCLFTLSANMSSFLADLDEAGDVWASFSIRYGNFYSRNGKVYYEQVVVLPYGSSETFAETLKFFVEVANLIIEDAAGQEPQNTGAPT